jgi:hypothetical protein
MYYNNHSFLRQLQGDGLALNRALHTQKLLVGAVVILSVTCIAITLHCQRQRALLIQGQREPEATE